MLKILNGYAGVGGNRKYWDNAQITAIEKNPEIAKAYQKLYPNDKVIITDCHEYLIEHYKEFDFIWLSPPCPSHSCVRKATEHQNKPIYPDMSLYQEIIFLQGYFKGKWVIENVMPYYKPLIPAKNLDRHLFWSNFPINEKEFKIVRKHEMTKQEFKQVLGLDLDELGVRPDLQRVVYRNCVDSNLGKYILDSAFKDKQDMILNYV